MIPRHIWPTAAHLCAKYRTKRFRGFLVVPRGKLSSELFEKLLGLLKKDYSFARLSSYIATAGHPELSFCRQRHSIPAPFFP